jgi:hypothetical protein
MQVETGRSNLPAYVPFQTFLNFLGKLEQGVPHRIDRSFLNRYYSGAMGSQLITSLRFLGLVEGDDNRTTAALERFVQEQAERKQLLAELLHERYQPVFMDVGDLAKATHLQLEQAFKQIYNVEGDTRRKAISFFVHLAQHAEVPLSAYIRTTSNPGSNRTTARTGSKKAKGRQNGTSAIKQRVATTTRTKRANTLPIQNGNTNSKTKTITFQSGGSVTLTYSVDLFDMAERDREFLLGLIDQLRDYEQGIDADDIDEEELEEDEVIE